jgi:hypothetical protein
MKIPKLNGKKTAETVRKPVLTATRLPTVKELEESKDSLVVRHEELQRAFVTKNGRCRAQEDQILLMKGEIEALHQSRRKDEQVLREISNTNQQLMIRLDEAETSATCMEQMIMRLEQELNQERRARKAAEAIVSCYPTVNTLATAGEQAELSKTPSVEDVANEHHSTKATPLSSLVTVDGLVDEDQRQADTPASVDDMDSKASVPENDKQTADLVIEQLLTDMASDEAEDKLINEVVTGRLDIGTTLFPEDPEQTAAEVIDFVFLDEAEGLDEERADNFVTTRADKLGAIR